MAFGVPRKYWSVSLSDVFVKPALGLSELVRSSPRIGRSIHKILSLLKTTSLLAHSLNLPVPFSAVFAH